jgi:predicted protein tyrosine phosphatase
LKWHLSFEYYFQLSLLQLVLPQFTRLLEFKYVQVLDIPDEYQYMDEELIDILEQSVSAYLGIARY